MKQLKVIQTERGGVVVDEEIKEFKINDTCVDLRDRSITTYQGAMPMYHYNHYRKILYSVYPLTLENIPMIGEPKMLSAEECVAKVMSGNWEGKSVMDMYVAMCKLYASQPSQISEEDIERMVEENFEGLTDAMGGDEALSHHYKGVIFECIKEASQSLQQVYSEEDLRKAMLHASYETLNNKGIISHRNIDEYIQSINPLPTSAIFTDDGEFINFKY